jgi:hypothetical protein
VLGDRRDGQESECHWIDEPLGNMQSCDRNVEGPRSNVQSQYGHVGEPCGDVLF